MRFFYASAAFFIALNFRPAYPAVFVHPGMLHNQAELDFVKDKVKAGAQPWKAALEKLRTYPGASLTWVPKPHADVIRGPYNNPDVGAGDMEKDGAAAYAHALQWSVTGDEAHARKTVEILNAWSGVLKSITGHDALLLVGMTGQMFLNAAELMRHTYTGWSDADQERFRSMLRNVYYPLIKDFFPTANGNWDASMIQTMMAMGVFLDDTAMFNRGVNHFLTGHTNGAIGNYVNAFGESQESGRDQGHTQMGLGFLGCAAEIGWKQGVDLYGALDNRLALGFEYTAQYNLGQNVRYEAYRSIDGTYNYTSISTSGRGGFRPIFERVYQHYHVRKGMDMPFTRQVVERNRPEGWAVQHASWGSLAYAGVPAYPMGYSGPSTAIRIQSTENGVVSSIARARLGFRKGDAWGVRIMQPGMGVGIRVRDVSGRLRSEIPILEVLMNGEVGGNE